MKKIISIVALAYVNIVIPANADYEPSFGYWTKCVVGWTETTVTSSGWHPNCNSAQIISTTIANCADIKYNCAWVQTFANPVKFQTCFQCSSGYELKSVPFSHGDCSYTYNTCKKITEPTVSSCTDCPDYSAWTDTKDGYNQRYRQVCSNNVCKIVATVYRCANNYYGINPDSGSTSKSGCKPCPSGGYSMAIKNASIESCFITAGDDETGHFKFSNNCYYTN